MASTNSSSSSNGTTTITRGRSKKIVPSSAEGSSAFWQLMSRSAHKKTPHKEKTDAMLAIVDFSSTKDWTSEISEVGMATYKGQQILAATLQTPLPALYKVDSYASNNILCLQNTKYGGTWRITNVFPVDKYGKQLLYCEVGRELDGQEKDPYCFNWEVAQWFDEEERFFRTIIKEKAEYDQNKPSTAFLLRPMTSFVRATIFNVDAIDTIQQSFVTKIMCEVRFRAICHLNDPTYVHQFFAFLRLEDKLTFIRIQEEESAERYNSYNISGIVADFYDYSMKFSIKGTFSEQLELQQFPIDSQELNLTLTCNKPNIIRFVENPEYPSIFMFNDFQLNSVFDVTFREYVFCTAEMSDPAESSSGYEYPRFRFTMHLTRKAGYYMSNVCVPIVVISGLSLLSLGINEDGSRLETGDRLGITLTLLLTGVAYKFVVASSLPQLSYLTLLDSYVWCCFTYMFIIALENVIFPIILHSYNKTGALEGVEQYIALVLGLLFVAGNLGWIVYVWRVLAEQKVLRQQVLDDETERRRKGYDRVKKSKNI